VDGKTGRRLPVLVPSVRYVSRRLDDHPGSGDDPSVSRLDRADSVSNNYVRDIFCNTVKVKFRYATVGASDLVLASRVRRLSGAGGVSQSNIGVSFSVT
jgi:hypothetical protein